MNTLKVNTATSREIRHMKGEERNKTVCGPLLVTQLPRPLTVYRIPKSKAIPYSKVRGRGKLSSSPRRAMTIYIDKLRVIWRRQSSHGVAEALWSLTNRVFRSARRAALPPAPRRSVVRSRVAVAAGARPHAVKAAAGRFGVQVASLQRLLVCG